jgi:hypothetical protein
MSPTPQTGLAPTLPEISEEAIAELVQNIETFGFAQLPNYLGQADLEHLRDFVKQKIAEAGDEYVAISGKPAFAGTMLDAITDAPAFLNLMHRVYEKAYNSAPRQALYQVLRCIKGETGLKQAYFFHYDSYVVTALLPIIIPPNGNKGNLLIKANRRPVRNSYLRNLVDKLLVDNRLAQIWLRRTARLPRIGFSEVEIVPGNLYFFWGYRSLHANEPCDPNQIRATALFHFADPHAESELRKITGRAKIRAAADESPGQLEKHQYTSACGAAE